MIVVTRQPTRQSISDDLDLVLETNGASITVKAGSFKIGGVEYQLAEDAQYTVTVPNAAYATTIFGYLVVPNTVPPGTTVSLLVDEISCDPTDVPYQFLSGGPHKLLATVFELQVPAGAPNWAGLNLVRFQLDPIAGAE